MITLSPASINFNICSGLAIYVGSEWKIPVTISQRDVVQGRVIETPVDLTGATGRCAIKKYAGADASIAIPTVEITDAQNGQILISLSAEETAAIIVQGNTWRDTLTAVYDVYLDDSETGESYRILMGTVDISPAVCDSNDHS
jgi:NaMN:DMB phosphoribosyltransferase